LYLDLPKISPVYLSGFQISVCLYGATFVSPTFYVHVYYIYMYLKSQPHFRKNFQISGTNQKPALSHRLSIPISIDIFK